MRIPISIASSQSPHRKTLRKSVDTVEKKDDKTVSTVDTSDSNSTFKTEDDSSNYLDSHHTNNDDDLCTQGLLITLEEDDACKMEYCLDANFDCIHPQVYCPADLAETHALAGGGSGAPVFGGNLYGQSVVMKHGGYKETRELLALATISQELRTRGLQANEEACELKQRIPEFRFLYVSPHHLQDPNADKWMSMKTLTRSFLPMDFHRGDAERSERFKERQVKPKSRDSLDVHFNTSGSLKKRGSARKIHLLSENQEENVAIHVRNQSLSLSLSPGCCSFSEEDNGYPCCASPAYKADQGYSFLKSLVDHLVPLQKQNLWKFTMGQKTIGGANPQTAAFLLVQGQLHGELLEHLIDQFIDVIKCLQALTTEKEADVLTQVKTELALIQSNPDMTSADLSKVADAYCGHGLTKNWHPKLGRFVRLRHMGTQFRSGLLHLAPEENLPAQHLGVLLQKGSHMGQVYEGEEIDQVSLDLDPQKWRSILAHAVLGVRCKAALRRVWTCGFSDAGLHNLFLSPEQLWLFDLGEPSLQALPGFLTKFLFSFFHTLGMEEDRQGGWVNRFVPGEKLALTEATKAILPQAYDAFEVTLDRICDELFFGEDGVRGLLVQYITLQLLSDCAFCLERWAVKGGGSHHRDVGIEKWLWRALWDVYIAFDINTKDWTCDTYRCYYSAFRRTPKMISRKRI